MIIDYAHAMRVAFGPSEYDSPLVVDPDRMEAAQVAPQLLQPVGWRYSQVFKPGGNVDGHELSLRPVGETVERSDDLILE
jgi:hypothetical protein